MAERYPLVLNGTTIEELQPGDTLSGVSSGGGGGGGAASPIFAWATYKAVSAVPSIQGSGGISGITRISAGLYRLHFATPQLNIDYGVVLDGGPYLAASQYYYPVWSTKTTAYIDITHAAINNGTALIDTFSATILLMRAP